MRPVYSAGVDGRISFLGNKLFGPVADIRAAALDQAEFAGRVDAFREQKHWGALSRINDTIWSASIQYLSQLGSIFAPLPLVTRMISSPGSLYGRERIDFTSDTSPIRLRWFDLPYEAFLSESSQIYLELYLCQEGISRVYSIYNSFRKEHADATHLSEFHHIEYEGQHDQATNIEVALGLIRSIAAQLTERREADLSNFISAQELKELADFGKGGGQVFRMSFEDALECLAGDTKDDRFKRFTMREFDAWAEIRLTEIVGGLVIVEHFPLYEVPFYHDRLDDKQGANLANNADFIWPGYREIIGSGYRVSSAERLEEKAAAFNLPRDDYEPYMRSRRKNYVPSSGFGVGWERLLQAFLRTPYIWTACAFPRVHAFLTP